MELQAKNRAACMTKLELISWRSRAKPYSSLGSSRLRRPHLSEGAGKEERRTGRQKFILHNPPKSLRNKQQ